MSRTTEVYVVGRVDGMGTPHPEGSYVELTFQTTDGPKHHIKISEGAAAVLIDELVAALDRLHV